jgi:Domain of unknown function (DUF932)
MNSLENASLSSYANAFARSLSLEEVQRQAPAVFATEAHGRVSARYCFIPTIRVVEGLVQAGFQPVEARQAQTRTRSPLHAQHVLRFRRRYETISLKDSSIPELVLVNDHSGAGKYLVLMGIHRTICSNGMIASRGALPTYCVPHRGNIVEEVVARAFEVSRHFERLAAQVEAMERRHMLKDDQLAFASRALALRFDDPATCGIDPAQLLTCRRLEDTADNLWVLLNKAQEHLCRGGLSRRSGTGKVARLRPIRSVSRDVKLNSQLWDLATAVLAA